MDGANGTIVSTPSDSTDEIDSLLTDEERDDFTELCEVVDIGLENFIQAGEALREIRDRKLYRESGMTFAEFVDDRFNLAMRRVYELIEETAVFENVRNSAQTPPTTRSHLAALSDIDDSDEQVEVYREAVETVPVNGKGQPKVTAKHIEDTKRRRNGDFEDDHDHGDDDDQGRSVDGDGDDGVQDDQPHEDHLGNAVPEHLKRYFEDEHLFDGFANLLTSLKKRGDKLRKSHSSRFFDRRPINALVRRLVLFVDRSQPYAICPACNGEACTSCRKTGVLTKAEYEQLQGRRHTNGDAYDDLSHTAKDIHKQLGELLADAKAEFEADDRFRSGRVESLWQLAASRTAAARAKTALKQK